MSSITLIFCMLDDQRWITLFGLLGVGYHLELSVAIKILPTLSFRWPTRGEWMMSHECGESFHSPLVGYTSPHIADRSSNNGRAITPYRIFHPTWRRNIVPSSHSLLFVDWLGVITNDMRVDDMSLQWHFIHSRHVGYLDHNQSIIQE